MRFINEIFTAPLGEAWTNERLLPVYEERISQLGLPEPKFVELRDFVRFQLVGERQRRTAAENLGSLTDFRSRAAAYERGVELALDRLSPQIEAAAEKADVVFDAVLTTTSTGNVMPGIGYRLARRLGALVRSDSMLIDLGNVGCTGSSKALNLARSLDPSFRNILIVSFEAPTTLLDVSSVELDTWQGNCTFGDGAAALWVSGDMEQGSLALAIEEMRYRQHAAAGLPLIRWGYHDYYRFELADHRTFEHDVKQFVTASLKDAHDGWKEESRWAIHPAGIALLLRLSRELGMPKAAIAASTSHYREHSNMSSASILYVLKDLAATTPVGSAINLLTMGAGFNVIYGRVRRVR